MTSRDLFSKIISRQTSRAILNFQIERLKEGALFGDLAQVFSNVKEFNVFGSTDVTVTNFEKENDTLSIKIAKGKLQIQARINL